MKQPYKNELPKDRSTPVILVVEDNPSDEFIIRHILQSEGYHVLVAFNGQKGLEMLDCCLKENLRLAAIISDILMPVMDGMQFLQKVRQRRELNETPFMFLTAVNETLIWDAQKYGASGYLSKPVAPDELLNKVREILSLSPSKSARDEMAA